MKPQRLEAFSDGVIAIIITIMVLEMKAPHEPTLGAMRPLLPVFLSYVLSFVFVGVYWNNHHHLFHFARSVSGAMLWANLHLLFWLSLIPFVTAWMGQNHFATQPVALYGCVLLMCAVAYSILTAVIIGKDEKDGRDSLLAKALGRDIKGKASLALYLCAIPLAFVHPGIAGGAYVCAAIMWLVPDRRIEKALHD